MGATAKPAAKRAAKSPARSPPSKSPAAKSAPPAKVPPSPFLPVVKDFYSVAGVALLAFVVYTFASAPGAATPPPAKDWTSWALGLVALT